MPATLITVAAPESRQLLQGFLNFFLTACAIREYIFLPAVLVRFEGVQMFKKVLVLTYLISCSSFAARVATAPASNDQIALGPVVEQVKQALNDYQANLGTGTAALPPLTSVEFDFKTTTDKVGGLSVNIFILKLGASRTQEQVNDMTFTYSIPKPTKGPGLASRSNSPPQSFKEALTQKIQSAADAAKQSGTLGKLRLGKLAVSVQYGVTWDGTGGVNVPFSFVTVGLSGEAKKNSVQSVKLIFGE